MLLSEPKRREYRTRPRQSDAPHFADRLPPQALDVERTILGSMLIDSTAVDIALEFLEDDNFYSEAHAKIFICMRELSERGTPVDVLTLSEKLRQKDWMDDIGAEAYLGELAENVATAGSIQHYAQIVREKSTLRQLIHVSGEITTECFSDEREAQEVLDAAEAKIFAISESRIKNKFESIGSLLPLTFKEIEDYAKGGVVGIPSGFAKLDELTTGFQDGDLVIVGGRPSMGKTAFCLAMAQHASKAGYSTAIFSLEMSKSQIAQRLLCAEAGISMHALRSGNLPKRDYPRLSMAAGPLAQAPLYIDDTAAISILELRAKARRLKAQHKLAFIIVDYLQLMNPSVKTDSMQQDISQISRSLKAVAKELQVPVVALSQLSRAVEQRTGDHRPKLSDLRESGAIEQDADLVLFVYRDEVYNKEDIANKGKAEIIIGKQRNGPLGTVDVAFVREYAKFEDLSMRIDNNTVSGNFDDANI
ncbi:MAG: replicative DNA helicase [Chitinispirillales bacterium]|jgi:replicative DNA helicase|nr:replicative DNA helicase [Chitinispirillales bacterium]